MISKKHLLCWYVLAFFSVTCYAEFQVNTYTNNDQKHPGVAMNSAGNTVVVWKSNSQDGRGGGILGQYYNSSGVPIGSQFQINTYTNDDQQIPAVAMDDNGRFIVVWESELQDGSGYGIFAEIVDGQCGDQNHPYPVGDLDHNCRVNWADFAIFASHWLQSPCTDPNWCGGADLDNSSQVNWDDFAIFAAHWLECTAVDGN